MPMRDLGPPKSRRCFFFDSEGYPIQKGSEYGCSRRAADCHFVHPSDPEWSQLGSHADNRRTTGEGSSRRSLASYHGRERRRSPSIDHYRAAPADSAPKRRRTPPHGSSTHHSDHQPRSPLRGASPTRSRSSFSSTSRDVRPLPRRSSSHDRPHSHPQPETASKPTQPKMSSGDRSSGKETKTLPFGSLKSPVLPTVSAAPKASSETTSTMPSSSAKVPPRSFSEILPPPPSMNSTLRDEMTPEQRRAVWETRVALMADATQEYMDLGKLEKDVESRRRQVQSPAFDTLPSEIRDAFQVGLTNATAACERKKASLNKAINKLSETDFWPSIPSQNVGDMEAKLKEAKTMLGGLADSVGQLYKRIESLYEQRTGRPGAGPSNADEVATGAVASGDGDTRTKKRPRLSLEGGDADSPDTDMREDVESIRDTVREIEDRLQEMENDIAQNSGNIVEQLEAKVDEKIEEIARSADISALVGGDQLGPQTAKTIQTFHENFAQADREIAELAQEMAELIPQLDALRRENDLSKQEEAAEKELFEQLAKADQDNAEAISRLQEEAKTLRSALTAHTKRALPASPKMPLSGPFLEAIKGSIVTQVQEHILPIVTQTRSEMERIAKTRDTELYEKLRDRLDQSLKMSQVISTWIEHNPEDARQALAAAARASGASSSGSVITS